MAHRDARSPTASGRSDDETFDARPAGGGPDDTDICILNELRRDSRMSIAELARKVHVSRASAYARVNRMVENGVIRRFTIDADPRALGLNVEAVIILRINTRGTTGSLDRLAAEVREIPEVEYCAITAGEFDAVMLVRARDIESVSDLVLRRCDAVEGVNGTKTSFVLREIVPMGTRLTPPKSPPETPGSAE